ncbi:hypothetical protein [Falsirhodobacter halotolerans]|uniref:hypothetical protein n=1 Tax=Falsirhodobacter halotolerans TaxID=1146892 RepID=UPI001FD11EE1|nr:hypothetical protein [Falsirhodobacter halotolerans]MCJ8139379.1 hypothetical protein [Falsirhodobacter halotolerans]
MADTHLLIERQQTAPLADQHVTQIWLSNGTCIRGEGPTSAVANLNAAWAFRMAEENARRGGEMAQPFPVDFPVKFAHPRDVLLALICDRLDGWPQFSDVRREALIELYGEIPE